MASHLEDVEVQRRQKTRPLGAVLRRRRQSGAKALLIWTKRRGNGSSTTETASPLVSITIEKTNSPATTWPTMKTANKNRPGNSTNYRGKGSDGRKTGTWTFYATDGETVWRRITYKRRPPLPRGRASSRLVPGLRQAGGIARVGTLSPLRRRVDLKLIE